MAMENRRHFLATAGVVLGSMALDPRKGISQIRDSDLQSRHPRRMSVEALPNGVGLPSGWRQIRKLDVHSHVMQNVHLPGADWSPVDNLVEAADYLGIHKLYCSHPLTGGVMATIDAVREANDSILASMKRHPGRIEGFCFVQPGNGSDALNEIERCLAEGMVGIKLYNQFKYQDSAIFPIAERCIERGIPFLGHSAYLTDPATRDAQPKTSNALDFCHLSKRYPELLLILGHINGGGDWEWTIKGLAECPNIFIDTSGSVQENGTIDRCVQELGHKRLLFGTDLTMEGGVGKILSAQLTPEQREDIFWRNFQGILDRRVT